MRKMLWGVLLVASLAAAQDRPAKKLLEYGWDVPYPDYLRAHIKDMEKKPFDGLLFRLKGKLTSGNRAKVLSRQVNEGTHLRRQVARAREYRVNGHLGHGPVR